MTWVTVFKELLIREENPSATKDAVASEEGGRVISELSWKLEEGPELVGEAREERGRERKCGESGEGEREREACGDGEGYLSQE